MVDVVKYFRSAGYKTYIVTGSGQDFVRAFAEQMYGIPPEQVVGTMGGTKYGYDKDGKPVLTKEPKLLLNDNNAGKPEGIHMMIGRRRSRRSAIRLAIGRCSNTRRPATALGSACSSCTTTPSASTPMAPRAGCPIQKSARSRKHFTTKQRNKAGS
jgi:hypothetical protein